jgi:antitoxin component YwqK of YwqJK toxin-antitoxin module
MIHRRHIEPTSNLPPKKNGAEKHRFFIILRSQFFSYLCAMKVWFFIWLFFCSATLVGQTDSLVFVQFKHKNGVVSSEGYLHKGKPDGYWKTYNEQGLLISEGNRKDYLLDSVWKFYTNNELTSEICYKEGKRNGLTKIFSADETSITPYVADLISGTREVFYKNGAIKQRTPFENGVEQGTAFDFSQDGVITGITDYRKGFIIGRQRINRTDKNGWKQGAWKFFYPDLIVQLEGTYLNDKKNGYFKSYDTLGNLIHVEKFLNDELVRDPEEISNVEVKTEYHPNGTPKLTATYKNGQLEGVAREYDETGKIVKGIVFEEGKPVASGIVDDRGLFQDGWKEFYPSGKVRAEGRYRNGKRSGKWQFYYPDGQLEQIGIFNNKGEYNGDWVWYYPSGAVRIEQAFIDGMEDGAFREYAEDGTIIAQGDYIEGLQHGDWVIYTGLEQTEGRFKDGERHGKWKTYSIGSESKLMFEGTYVDGIPNGRHIYYQDNGKILEEGVYSMGKQNGTWKKYDERGQVYVTIMYKNDDEVRYDNVRTEPRVKK